MAGRPGRRVGPEDIAEWTVAGQPPQAQPVDGENRAEPDQQPGEVGEAGDCVQVGTVQRTAPHPGQIRTPSAIGVYFAAASRVASLGERSGRRRRW